MGFIDDYERDVHIRKIGLERPRREPFGREIQELEVAVGGVVERQVDLVTRHTRIDGEGLYPPVLQVLDLVLHQGDERRHDQRDALFHHPRDLEAYRLASAGRQYGQHVLAGERIHNDALLHRPETLVAPVLLKYVDRSHHIRRSAPTRRSCRRGCFRGRRRGSRGGR